MKAKRILALTLALTLLLCFAACTKKEGNITAKLISISEDSGMKTYYLSNKDYFTDKGAAALGMSAEDAKSFISGSGNWGVYTANVTVTNKADKAYTFASAEVGDITAEGLWLSGESANGEVSVPAGVEDTSFPLTMVVNLDKLTVIDIYKAVSQLKINIVCYPTPADDEAEPDEKSTEKIAVESCLVVPDDNTQATQSEVSAKRGSLEDGNDVLESYKSSDIAFSNESQLYGMSSETAAHVIAKGSRWECYVLNIDIENKADKDQTFYTVNAENNGASGVWICSVSQYGEFGMPAGDVQSLPVTVLVDPDVTGGKTAAEIIAGMKITLSYSNSPTIGTDGSESLEVMKTASVG